MHFTGIYLVPHTMRRLELTGRLDTPQRSLSASYNGKPAGIGNVACRVFKGHDLTRCDFNRNN